MSHKGRNASPFLSVTKKRVNVSGLTSRQLQSLNELIAEMKKSPDNVVHLGPPATSTKKPPARQPPTGSRPAPAPQPPPPVLPASATQQQQPSSSTAPPRSPVRSLPPQQQPQIAARNLRSSQQTQPTTRPQSPIDVDEPDDGAAHGGAPPALRPLPNPISQRVVIFDNITNMSRKELEPELCRIAAWLQPAAVDIMRSGGLRVKCKTPADADRLLKRDGFPDDAFHGRYTVHRPGKIDESRPVSKHLDKDLRSVITSRLPIHYDAADLRHIFKPEYVEEIRDIPPKDLNRPPLRIIVMRTKELRDDAIENGLFFFNRRVAVRPLRSPVLPLFCRKCSGFDHTAVDCKKPVFTCSKCAGNHETSACIVQQRDALCPNCPADSNNHFATYRGCPAFKAAATKEIERREARINAKLAARERRQPRRQFASENAPRSAAPAPVRPGVSFAAAAQRNVGQPQPQPLPQQPPQNDVLQKITETLDKILAGFATLNAKFLDLEKRQHRLEAIYDIGDDDSDAELMDVGNDDLDDSHVSHPQHG